MNVYQFMHQHKILDALERFFETIPRNVNIYKDDWIVLKNLQRPVWMVSAGLLTPSSRLCKYLPSKYRNWFRNWYWFEAFHDPPSHCFYAWITYVQTFVQNFEDEKHPRQNGSLRHSVRNVVKDLGVQLQVSLRFLHCGRFICKQTWETLEMFQPANEAAGR